ncbi:UDP-N-acetylmuramoyl-L-alanyl-D-glutamate--2,6-diaminopimelate ligase [Alkalicoccus daliensis]|uniref:UDP-N-acetylmuramoylalanyl-D-glutamate--2,6-diaminopimelate ligase n=1 Tax=Alkalicoccus daliensis TaxID=745820 RepID=A0A1H0E4N4_9BACI|nr:UDP-N-acetylmuramoyl-L-alanyl-D-glutamate--2,6-diaminopimelate ligase [Alkalicoccus daliensis]SDN77372.1 UDP-N-acetylmuramoylalanyl-D-glutamate--2,6-diaminopimelate ligase [Alkalicoccus daliensis]
MLIHFTTENNSNIREIFGCTHREIEFITYDSRRTVQNTAFFCIKGSMQDGHEYIKQAIINGAAVIVGTDETLFRKLEKQLPHITFVLAKDTQKAMSYYSQLLNDFSCYKISTIAVTGTNGKTTVTSFIRYLLNQCGVAAGSIGTEGVWDDKQQRDFPHSTHTTPEAPDLHYIFTEFVKEQLNAAVLEVTSIAIAQQRVDGLMFDIGVHTNLTPEHIDYHSSYESYKQAKLKMFRQVRKAVVNKDDKGMGQDIIDIFTGPLYTYSLKSNADVTGKILEVTPAGTQLELKVKENYYSVELPLFGEHNIYNFLAALCACLHKDISVKSLLKHAPGITTPRGRLQIINTDTDYQIIADFAHTPDALDNIVRAARSMRPNKLIVLIAANGVRDKSQQPQLLETMKGKADHLIVAVEHPDRFDRAAILHDMLKDSQGKEELITELYREDGVRKALELAGKGDIVLLTGLGVLDHQIINGVEVPYSEIDIIHDYLEEHAIRNN